MGNNLSVHTKEEAQVVTITYLKNQPLEITVSSDGSHYKATVYYDEVLEGFDQQPRYKLAKAIYTDDVPDAILQSVKDIITKYLVDTNINIGKETKFYN